MTIGIDPPNYPLCYPPDPPSIPRPCIECGKMHDTGWQDMKTGAMLERFDKCADCLRKGWFKVNPILEQVKLRDTST
jgi:hypothetical protein